jgi:murein DD-endopeptidase MepM/ murein hydrolase activator NlpD
MHWFTALTLLFAIAWGYDIPKGKSLVVTLPSPAGEIVGTEHNISVVIHPSDPGKGMAVIPVDYYAQSGDSNVTWIAPGNQTPIPIRICDFPYPTEVLSVEPSKVTPPPEALERIALEKAEAEAIYTHFTPVRYWNKPFILPLDSNITSAYGSARTYNGVLKSYHGGVDFRALTPTPIQATNDGIVVLAKERYYAGGTIIIDHGEGIYSCYFHLSRFDVQVGERVVRGQPIALSGASGRITGPHLHFGMMVHGVQSDPLDLLAQFERLFDSETGSAAADPSISLDKGL